MGNNHGARLCHRFIALDVIRMVVRIDQVTNRLLADLSDGRHNFLVQRSILGVHQQDAVASDGNADISSLAYQHVESVRDLNCLYLDLVSIYDALRPSDPHQACQDQHQPPCQNLSSADCHKALLLHSE